MAVARPNKFLDAADLEEWANNFEFAVLDEWECSDAPELGLDFWNYLDQEYPDIMGDFIYWWRNDRENFLASTK